MRPHGPLGAVLVLFLIASASCAETRSTGIVTSEQMTRRGRREGPATTIEESHGRIVTR